MCRVICLGEVLFDCIANDLGVTMDRVQSWKSYVGGAPANVASALAKLGTSAAMVGCIGEDVLGDSAYRYLTQQGVSTQGIQKTSQFPTRQVYVLRSLEGDRFFAGFSQPYPDAFADAYLRATRLPERLFVEAEYLVIGTLELAYPQSREAVFQALELADRYHLKIFLDVNHRPVFWENPNLAKPIIKQLYPRIDFLKLSAEEALWLFDTQDAAEISQEVDTAEGIFVTDGSKEVSYVLSEQIGKVQPLSVAVKDTTGAGDGFVAGIIHQLTQYRLIEVENPETARKIVSYGCAVGSFVTTKEGAMAAQPTAAELKRFIRDLF